MHAKARGGPGCQVTVTVTSCEAAAWVTASDRPGPGE